MRFEEIPTGTTAGRGGVLTFLYGLLLIVSVLVVVTQVRLSGIVAAALACSLTGALFAGWAKCWPGWALLRRVLTAATRRRAVPVRPPHRPVESASPGER